MSVAASFVHMRGDGADELCLLVPDMHCGGCVAEIEKRLAAVPGVASARANLSNRQVAVAFLHGTTDADALIAAVAGAGFEATPYDPAMLASRDDAEEKALLRALAVAGFAAANVMLLSVGVWAGSDMDPATRDLLHWVSALIALPAVAYAGRPFFRAAWQALSARAVTMDVPIALAVLLAAGMSLYETMHGGAHAYFDASVTLLFFLLIGRYLDRQARRKATSAAEKLLLLNASHAMVLDDDGNRRAVPLAEIAVGMKVALAPGDRFPVDGRVVEGRADIDNQLISGETAPHAVQAGDAVHAGTINRNGALVVQVTATGDDTLLGEIGRLVRQAEQARGGYVRLADRLAAVYAPAVHIVAAATFAGWMLAGSDWRQALLAAVAVLIITCPCALGLAVPVVQVVAAGRLFQRGILLKSGDALERLAAVDQVVFDKTGTLTDGQPVLVNADRLSAEDLRLAAALAKHSRHPLARALHGHADGDVPLTDWREEPGRGVRARLEGIEVRLGSRAWSGNADADDIDSGPELWLRRGDAMPLRLRFADRPRGDAAEVVSGLGLPTEILSGDRATVVAKVATALGIGAWRADQRPADKTQRLRELADDGHRVLMIGDGLNDAAALAAAHVSMAPAAAADVSQTSADLIFQGRKLAPVAEALTTARRARALMTQNFGLALAYNLVAVPLAVAGLATPMVAAIAMSSSSLLVTLNALRLRGQA
ncbi:MAG: heavy metal translocating P-type ATPase [Alphaproteobacteria bacterium]